MEAATSAKMIMELALHTGYLLKRQIVKSTHFLGTLLMNVQNFQI